jgi:hypothetical protein
MKSFLQLKNSERVRQSWRKKHYLTQLIVSVDAAITFATLDAPDLFHQESISLSQGTPDPNRHARLFGQGIAIKRL